MNRCLRCLTVLTGAHLILDLGQLCFWTLEGHCRICGFHVVKCAWAATVEQAARAWKAGQCWETFEEALRARAG
jgi:hypothetical protein